MANPQNLRPPWRAGESGNPGGHSRDRRKLSQLEAGGDFNGWLALFIETQNRSIQKRLRALRVDSAESAKNP